MTIIFVLLLLLSFFIAKNKTGSYFCINTIYALLWCIGGVLVDNNCVNLYSVSNDTLLYIVISILAVNIGFYIQKKNNSQLIPNWEISNRTFRLIISLHIVAYILTIPVLLVAINIITAFGWDSLREYAYATEDNPLMSKEIFQLYTVVFNPIFTSTILLTPILVMSKSKFSRTLIGLSISDLFLTTCSFGGRTAIVRALLFVVISILLNSELSQTKVKIKRSYLLGGGLIFALLAFLTSLRSHAGLNFLESAYVYLYGSIVYFDQIINDSNYFAINSQLLYGNATFGFLTSIPQYILYRITGVNNVPDYLIDLTSNDYIYIAPTVRYNALATALFSFWRDGRALGVFVGSLVLVSLYHYSKRKCIVGNSFFYYSFMIMVAYVMVTSTMTYNLLSLQHSMTLFFIYLFTRKSTYINIHYKIQI